MIQKVGTEIKDGCMFLWIVIHQTFMVSGTLAPWWTKCTVKATDQPNQIHFTNKVHAIVVIGHVLWCYVAKYLITLVVSAQLFASLLLDKSHRHSHLSLLEGASHVDWYWGCLTCGWSPHWDVVQWNKASPVVLLPVFHRQRQQEVWEDDGESE